MKAITLHQPYATAIALGCKTIETRGFRTHHRGLIAIHAGKFTPVAHAAILQNAPEAHRAAFIGAGYHLGGQPSLIKLPQGCIVAIAEIAGVDNTEGLGPWLNEAERHWGNYADGRFCWTLTNIRRLATPIKTRGFQGLWDWDAPTDLQFVSDSVTSVQPPSASVKPSSRLPVLSAYRLPTNIQRPPFATA